MPGAAGPCMDHSKATKAGQDQARRGHLWTIPKLAQGKFYCTVTGPVRRVGQFNSPGKMGLTGNHSRGTQGHGLDPGIDRPNWRRRHAEWAVASDQIDGTRAGAVGV